MTAAGQIGPVGRAVSAIAEVAKLAQKDSR